MRPGTVLEHRFPGCSRAALGPLLIGLSTPTCARFTHPRPYCLRVNRRHCVWQILDAYLRGIINVDRLV
jgi:hypothetical protein